MSEILGRPLTPCPGIGALLRWFFLALMTPSLFSPYLACLLPLTPLPLAACLFLIVLVVPIVVVVWLCASVREKDADGWDGDGIPNSTAAINLSFPAATDLQKFWPRLCCRWDDA